MTGHGRKCDCPYCSGQYSEEKASAASAGYTPESNDLLSPDEIAEHWQATREIWGAFTELQKLLLAIGSGSATAADLEVFHDSIVVRLDKACALIRR